MRARHSIYVVDGFGASYVGCTGRSVDARWHEHCVAASRGSRRPLHRAIVEHGSAQFDVRVVAQARCVASGRITEGAVAAQLRAEGVELYNECGRLHYGGHTRARVEELWLRRVLGEDVAELAREFGMAPSSIPSTFPFWPLLDGARKGLNMSRVARELGAEEMLSRVRLALDARGFEPKSES